MIHTYHEPGTPESGGGRFVRSGFFALLVVVLVVVAASALRSPTWDNLEGLGSLAVFFALPCVFGLLHERYRCCREIRLSDDGMCELETKGRVIRLHVNEIRSVHLSRSEGDSEYYTIRYRGGKLRVSQRITEFGDFLARLKILNPGVRLTGFPADAWPGLEIAAPSAGHRIRDAVFPLIVVSLLIYLASQTLLSR